jgi:plasmid stabilization system protein ParE
LPTLEWRRRLSNARLASASLAHPAQRQAGARHRGAVGHRRRRCVRALRLRARRARTGPRTRKARRVCVRRGSRSNTQQTVVMNLRWDARALQDLQDISRYLGTHASPAAAERIRKHLRTRAHRLRTRPLIGVASSNPENAHSPPHPLSLSQGSSAAHGHVTQRSCTRESCPIARRVARLKMRMVRARSCPCLHAQLPTTRRANSAAPVDELQFCDGGFDFRQCLA